MHPVVEDLVGKARTIAKLDRLVGATEEQISALEKVAGNPLPGIWVDLLGSCLGNDSGFYKSVCCGPKMVEPFSHPVSAGAEIDLIGDIISNQQRFKETPAVEELLGGLPFFCVGQETGSGATVLLVGSYDPHVVLLDDGLRARTWSLVCLKLSSWLKGLLPQDGVGDRLRQYPKPPPSQFTLNAAAAPPTAEVLELVDEMLDALISTPLPSRGSPETPVGREWIVGPDHGWLRERPNQHGYLQIDADSLHSRYQTLLNAVVGAALISVAGGSVEDRVGVFGRGAGVALGATQAREALVELAVDGDFDDLCLSYRANVAKPAYQAILLAGD